MTDREVLSKEELKQIFKEGVREELERIGLHAEDAEGREEIRDDMRFLRRIREAANGAASKVGYAMILGVLGTLGSIFMFGVQVKFGK